jgi:hypothetical protein
MKKIIISLILFLFSSGFVFAVDIVYPIPELGNCADKKACENYCNKSENMESCINYAEKNNLMTKEEIKISKAVAIKIKEGKMPGNCNDKKTCENYCQGNVANLDECLAFADEIGMTDDSIIEGKKIAKALKEGVNLPGNCKTKNECKTYCADLNNIDECLNFGDKAGIIDPEELSEAKKVIAFIKSGETPGKCKRKADCDAYCKIESNFAECLAFAEKAGFVSKEEAELAKKAGTNAGPGGCRGEEECQKYCAIESHLEECLQFGIKVGIISEEEAELAKEGAENLKAGLEKIPLEARPDAESCLNNIFDGRLQDVLDKKVPITRIQGEKIGSCIEGAVSKYVEKMKQQAAPQGGNIPEGVQGPPVNIPTGTPPPTGVQQGPPCSSPEECMKMFGPR